jgi:hypothetical protein
VRVEAGRSNFFVHDALRDALRGEHVVEEATALGDLWRPCTGQLLPMRRAIASGRPLQAQVPGRGSCAVCASTRATQPGIPDCQQHCFSAVPWNMPSLTK